MTNTNDRAVIERLTRKTNVVVLTKGDLKLFVSKDVVNSIRIHSDTTLYTVVLTWKGETLKEYLHVYPSKLEGNQCLDLFRNFTQRKT